MFVRSLCLLGRPSQGFPLLSLFFGFSGFCCGLSFLSGTTTLVVSLGGRLPSSLFWANEPADTRQSIVTVMSFGINFFISSLASSCKLRAHGKEKETRRPVPSKMGATRRLLANTSFSCVGLSIRPQNSHRFEPNRTVSCNPPNPLRPTVDASASLSRSRCLHSRWYQTLAARWYVPLVPALQNRRNRFRDRYRQCRRQGKWDSTASHQY